MNDKTIAQINASEYKFCANITGGGAAFLSGYLARPKASKTFLQGIIPYSCASIDTMIGKPEKYCNHKAAKKLSLKAFEDAYKFCKTEGGKPVGIGASCIVHYDGERKGREHKIYIHVHSETKTKTLDIILSQGLSREVEEELISDLILAILAKTCDVKDSVRLKIAPYYDYVIHSKFEEYKIDKKWLEAPKKDNGEVYVFPGSFNPLHCGHKNIVNKVQSHYNCDVLYEICMGNVDKANIDYIDINKRLSNFNNPEDLIVIPHAYARFIDKYNFYKKHYNKVNFIMGYDTYERLLVDQDFKKLVEEKGKNGEKVIVLGSLQQCKLQHGITKIGEAKDVVHIHEDFFSDIRSSKIRAEKVNKKS